MDSLFERFYAKLAYTPTDFIRGNLNALNSNVRLTGIKGPRGVGKTTLLLQYIKKNFRTDQSVLYTSLDNIWFSEHKLYHLADDFAKRGGKYLFLDEVHKYPSWSQELKNIYDDFPALNVVFTGSSLLEILNARADLSRRAVVHTMQGLSFREFIGLYAGISLPVLTLNEIVSDHIEISASILKQLKPLQYFSDYLKWGYYPFYKEAPELYFSRIEEVINMIMEIELPLLRGVDLVYIPKLKQILMIIAESTPFVPNISKLSERIGINRKTLLLYIYYLQEAGIFRTVFKDASGISRLQKPDKLFLDNTNLAYTLSDNVNEGNSRELFFVNQLSYRHTVEYAEQGDFLIDGKYLFETGGKNKGSKQIKDIANAWIAADGIEYGSGNKIPLWLFGFLY